MRKTIKQCADTIQQYKNPDQLIVNNPKIPVMYCLPKIHNTDKRNLEDIPLRRVIAQMQAPSSKLAHWLNSIFKNITDFESKFSIKNTYTLIEKIKNIEVPENSFLVSFDIKDLFPSVPPAECKILIKKHLDNSNLDDTQKLHFLNLFNICLDQNSFQFNKKIYTQTNSLGMGSSLSPLLSEMFLKNLEDIHLNNNKY